MITLLIIILAIILAIVVAVTFCVGGLYLLFRWIIPIAILVVSIMVIFGLIKLIFH